jgi:leader peptidase (prepilin peptidase)/N-methyltransferase
VLAWISWQALITGTFLAFILASVYGIALILTRGANRGSQLPLGPFMLVGALAAAALMPM